ncbi:hypothetical protein FRUB_02497 [Fimbriiglobus ruber]|uniref:Uncharacterized protein n=1 Tax=Fimbriiglobus ruber TaxID=1908690 RepID=A0A225E7C6_9BACT|nr:hypothetical protein FRUB_02497 [Fimbriiglobus ruber]
MPDESPDAGIPHLPTNRVPHGPPRFRIRAGPWGNIQSYPRVKKRPPPRREASVKRI